MNSAFVLFFGILLITFSLWKIPDRRTKPKPTAGGFFFWLSEALLLLLNDFVLATTRLLYGLHCRDLLPMWAVNIPYSVFPRSWMRAAAGAHLRRCKKNGGQL